MIVLTRIRRTIRDVYDFRVESMRFMRMFGKLGVLCYMASAYLGFKLLGIWIPVMALKVLYAAVVTVDIFAYMEAKRG